MVTGPVLQAKLDLPGSSKNLQSVREVIESTASEVGFSVDDVRKIVTAAFEAVANAVTHGSPLESKNTISITISVYADKLVVEVADQGEGFPLNILKKMPDTSSPRGRGIPLMYSLVDEVKFENNSGGRVILTKYRG
ncbi:MAG: anti-sigma regulatory factor [Armatimonadota bacterium]